MIHELDETLRQLLIQKAGLDPAEVDISFDIPTRDWSTPVTRPTVNLYLYDIRENRQLREMFFDEEPAGNGKVKIKRVPIRIDLSYMVTCWTSAAEDQHRLLWHVLETFFRNSPLPDEVLQGQLRQLIHPVRTEVAQPDGVLKNVSDFWGALENQLRPAISLVVTLELDLSQVSIEPLAFAKLLRVGQRAVNRDGLGRETPADRLEPGWDALPIRLGGVVRSKEGQPVANASVRLLTARPGAAPVQFGPTIQTDPTGQYLFTQVPPGLYTLVIEIPGYKPEQRQLELAVRERGEPLPEFVHEVEVRMK